MAKKLTIHLRDKATDTYVEVDGERIEAGAVMVTFMLPQIPTVTLNGVDAEVIDERTDLARGSS